MLPSQKRAALSDCATTIATDTDPAIMPLLRGDPFHRLTICGVFRRSIEVFVADPLTFLKIGVIGAVPGFCANWLFLSKFADLLNFDDVTDPEAMNEQLLEAAVALIGPLIVILILTIAASLIINVATIRSTIQIYVGKQPFLAQNLKHGLRLFPRLCCLQLAFLCGLVFLASVVGLIVGVLSLLLTGFIGEDATFVIVILSQICIQAVSMYFTCTLVLWDTALVVEGLPEFQPFFRSYGLVKGQCCFVFCAIFLEGLAMITLLLINSGLFGGLGSTAVAIAQSLTEVVLTPYAGIFLTVIYVNSRIKKEEECNGTILAQEMKLDSSEGTGSHIALQQPEAPADEIDTPLLAQSEEPNAMV